MDMNILFMKLSQLQAFGYTIGILESEMKNFTLQEKKFYEREIERKRQQIMDLQNEILKEFEKKEKNEKE